MMNRWEIRVAARYLLMASKRGHTAFLTIISTLGLAVGVATLIISLALLSGLQGEIKGRLIASTPQILIEPVGSNAIENAGEIVTAIRQEEGAAVQRVVSGIAWASDREGTRGRPVRIRSFEPGEEPAADPSFALTREPPAEPEGSRILLTRDFAAEIGLLPGDPIVIVAPRQRLTPFGAVPVYKIYTIGKVLPAAIDESEPDARLPFEEASRLFGTGGHPSSIEVYTSLESAAKIREATTGRGWPILVRDWSDINKPLFLALRLEKIVMFVTISLIILVAALNLISSVAMLIVEKRPQVGVLRTLGATERSILKIYLATGLLIGFSGTLLGNFIGLGVSWAADFFALIPLPRHVYAIAHLPFRIEISEVVAVNVIAVILSIFATWYPARLAARLDPIAAIRGE